MGFLYPLIRKFTFPAQSLFLDLQIQLPTWHVCVTVSKALSTHHVQLITSLLQTSPQLCLSYYWPWMSFLSQCEVLILEDKDQLVLKKVWNAVISFLLPWQRGCCTFTHSFQSTLTSGAISRLHSLHAVNKLAYSQTWILIPTTSCNLSLTSRMLPLIFTFIYPLL